MQVYQTNELSPYQWEQMKKFLDEEIGTDFEVDNSEPNVFCVTVFDLTSKEVHKIRDFENNRLDEPYEKFCVVFGERGNARPLRTEWFDDYEDAEQKLAEINTHFRDEHGERRFWGSVESSMPSQQYQRLNGAYPVRAALNVDSEEAIQQDGVDFNQRVRRTLLRATGAAEPKEVLPEEILKELDVIAKMNALGSYMTEVADSGTFDAVVYKNASLKSVDLDILSEWDYYSEAEIREMVKQEYLSQNSLFQYIAKMSYEAGLRDAVANKEKTTVLFSDGASEAMSETSSSRPKP